jgi:hypothetical protein
LKSSKPPRLNWPSFFDKIYLINLSTRTDRLLASAETLEQYEIPYTRISAIHDKEQGARGLRDTMLLVFEDAINNGYDNILVFEDDVTFVVGKDILDDVMTKCIEQLPENYHLLYLGGQPTGGFPNFYSNNLLPVHQFFATHAVAYSKQAIKEILIRDFSYPIDNWIVKEIQNQGKCYCTNPMLARQRPDHSDINGQFVNWQPFIDQRFSQKLSELHGKTTRR